MAGGGTTLEYTPTWVVALVCSVIVSISFAVERLIHRAGKVIYYILAPCVYFICMHNSFRRCRLNDYYGSMHEEYSTLRTTIRSSFLGHYKRSKKV